MLYVLATLILLARAVRWLVSSQRGRRQRTIAFPGITPVPRLTYRVRHLEPVP